MDQIDILGYALILYEMMCGKLPQNSFKLSNNQSPELRDFEEVIDEHKIKYSAFEDIKFSFAAINQSHWTTFFVRNLIRVQMTSYPGTSSSTDLGCVHNHRKAVDRQNSEGFKNGLNDYD
ncbi:hypothetical protein RF11_11096 [Thelohanellus kitauei]|uniref:Uncharacterized protein n=1 Tax=Thelohanellus kitauei TaxID=669202 RepID=A0A0C2MZ78_THEKT|nr:hypothetical protein RF11_11096 [Thelohanellus kitauei]